jgi:hypothetical protein
VQNATNGFALVRDVAINGILSDAFSGSTLIINSTVSDIDPGSSAAHPDILQFYGCNPENIIAYGLTSDPACAYPNGVQGFFLGGTFTHTDYALVNCYFHNAPSWSQAFMIAGTVRNMLIRNTTFAGPASWGSPLTTTNVMIEAATWTNGCPPARPGVIFRGTSGQ